MDMQGIKKEKKVTLEQLIKKKLDRDNEKNATKEIYIESLDGTLTFNNPSDSLRIEYSEKVKTGNYADVIDAVIKVIYDCCQTLHSKELQKEIEVQYPYDTVKAIFDIDEIMTVGTKLIKFFDESEEVEEEAEENLKN